MLTLGSVSFGAEQADSEEGFVSLFDGKTLGGWKVGNNPESFQVVDGMIVVNGKVAHLFYDGPVANHDFKNFHFKADVMTMPNSNSGIYFHTRYQEQGFPNFGLECQVNNSHKDWRRTGGLYGVINITDTPPKETKEATITVERMPVKDEVWYTQEIIVQGRHVVVKLAGQTALDYTLPPEADGEYNISNRQTYLPRGTFALQGHDPGSTVKYKNIRVKVLPD
jgi:hypothetical protein